MHPSIAASLILTAYLIIFSSLQEPVSREQHFIHDSGKTAVADGRVWPNCWKACCQRFFAHISKKSLVAVMWIRDILIRIPIRGSVPLFYGSIFGSGSCLLLYEITYTSIFKGIKSKKKEKNSKNQGFSYLIACQCKYPDPDPYK